MKKEICIMCDKEINKHNPPEGLCCLDCTIKGLNEGIDQLTKIRNQLKKTQDLVRKNKK